MRDRNARRRNEDLLKKLKWRRWFSIGPIGQAIRKIDLTSWLFRELTANSAGSGLLPYEHSQVPTKETRDDRLAVARRLERDVLEFEYEEEERRSQSITPRAGLILALNGGLVATLLGPLSPLEPKLTAVVSSWPDGSYHVAWMAGLVSSCLAVVFGLAALRIRRFASVTLPTGFASHILEHLRQEPAAVKGDKMFSDFIRTPLQFNKTLITKKLVLLDCAVRLTQTSIIGVATLCGLSTVLKDILL